MWTIIKNIGITKSQKFGTIASFVLAVVLLMAQEWADIGLNSVIVSLALSVPLFALPKKTYIYYAFFCIPLCFGLHGIFCMLLLISLYIRQGKSNVYQIRYPLILAFLEIFNCLFYSIPQVDIVKLCVYFAFLGVFFYAVFFESQDDATLLKFLCLGFAFGLLILFVRILLFSSLEEMLNASARASFSSDDFITTSGNHFVMNANNIAFYSIALFSTVLCSWKLINMSLKWAMILGGLAFSIGIFTYSRTWILCVIMLVALYVLMSKFREKMYFSLLVMVVFAYLVYSDSTILSSVLDAFQSRFEEGNLETAGDRTVLFNSYNNWFSNHAESWLSGTGVIYYKDVCRQANSMHNGFQQVLICTGIFGVAVFIKAFFIVKQLFGTSKSLFMWLPLIVITFFDQSVQLLNPHLLLFPFILGVYALKVENVYQQQNK